MIEGERSLVRHGPAESQQHLERRKHHAGNVVVSYGREKTAAFSQRRQTATSLVCVIMLMTIRNRLPSFVNDKEERIAECATAFHVSFSCRNPKSYTTSNYYSRPANKQEYGNQKIHINTPEEKKKKKGPSSLKKGKNLRKNNFKKILLLYTSHNSSWEF
jgi:hypothetical protein